MNIVVGMARWRMAYGPRKLKNMSRMRRVNVPERERPPKTGTSDTETAKGPTWTRNDGRP